MSALIRAVFWRGRKKERERERKVKKKKGNEQVSPLNKIKGAVFDVLARSQICPLHIEQGP